MYLILIIGGTIAKGMADGFSKMKKEKGLLYTITYGVTRIAAEAVTSKGTGSVKLISKATRIVSKKGGNSIKGVGKAGDNVAVKTSKGDKKYAILGADKSKKSAKNLKYVASTIKKKKTNLNKGNKSITFHGTIKKYKNNRKCNKINVRVSKNKQKKVGNNLKKAQKQTYKKNKAKRSFSNFPKELKKQLKYDKKGYTKSNMKLGTKIHKEYKKGWDGTNGKYKEYTVRGSNPKIRLDVVDLDNRVIYELKPNNPNGIKAGKKQLERYRKEMERLRGGKWTVVLDTY